MNSLPGAPLYISLEPALIAECTTTADCTVVEGRILDALHVEDQEGVHIDFNHEECVGRIHGLTFEDRSRIASMLEIRAGEGVGTVTVLPDPELEDEAERMGC